MRRRRMFAWLMLAVLLAMACTWLSDLVLWAQEGSLSQEEVLQKRQEKVAQLAPPTTAPAAGPQVTYEEALPPGQAAANRWSNMNWFALYVVFAVPTTYFVFRGAAH